MYSSDDWFPLININLRYNLESKQNKLVERLTALPQLTKAKTETKIKTI